MVRTFEEVKHRIDSRLREEERRVAETAQRMEIERLLSRGQEDMDRMRDFALGGSMDYDDHHETAYPQEEEAELPKYDIQEVIKNLGFDDEENGDAAKWCKRLPLLRVALKSGMTGETYEDILRLSDFDETRSDHCSRYILIVVWDCAPSHSIKKILRAL